MRTVWPEFALTLWNDKLNQNARRLRTHGTATTSAWPPVLERQRRRTDPGTPEAGDQLKTIDIDQEGDRASQVFQDC